MTHPQKDRRRDRTELALLAILVLFALWVGHLISAPAVTR